MTENLNNLEVKFVKVFRAQPLSKAIPKAVISIEEKIPPLEFRGSSRARFVEDAKSLAEALGESLPGGTFDALLGELLAAKASLFLVPYSFPPGVEAPRDIISGPVPAWLPELERKVEAAQSSDADWADITELAKSATPERIEALLRVARSAWYFRKSGDPSNTRSALDALVEVP